MLLYFFPNGSRYIRTFTVAFTNKSKNQAI